MTQALPTIQTLGILCFMLNLSFSLLAQQTVEREIKPFKKVMVGEGINLVIEEGAEENLVFESSYIDPQDIVTEVSGKKLSIYLAGCKNGCDDKRYKNAEVTAHLTYQVLHVLNIRGDNEVVSHSDINSNKFKLRSFGDSHIRLQSVYADRMKVTFFGDAALEIEDGKVRQLRIKSFGDNTINVTAMPCEISQIHAFGDSDVNITVHGKMNVTVFGDTHIQYHGDPWVNKKLVLGELSLDQQ